MKRDQIIQMARDAKIGIMLNSDGFVDFAPEGLERFAAAIRAATKDEDAKICDQFANVDAQYCADAIRTSK